MSNLASLHAYNEARKVVGPCAAFRAAFGQASGRSAPAPLQLFYIPRRRRRRLLRVMQRGFLTLAFCAVALFAAGVITALLPSPY